MLRYMRKSSRDNARTPMQWNKGKMQDLVIKHHGSWSIQIIKQSMLKQK